MELKREQIIKALECCRGKGCKECPYNCNCATCIPTLQGDALSLIKELTEENERLRAENARYEAENHAEFNKWLKLEEATKRHHSELFEEAKIVVKEETVRKMQELIKKRCIKGGIYPAFVASTIDQIAKELEGGEK